MTNPPHNHTLTAFDQALQQYGVACWAYYTAASGGSLCHALEEYREQMLTERENLLQYVMDNFIRKPQ
jgi:hypothetical protein